MLSPLAAVLVAILLIGPTTPVFAQSAVNNTAPDNTAVNMRDRSSTEPTADQGQNNASDLATMQQVRKAVVSDKSLSTYAHNIKIVSQGGKVTLKGPVRSQQESDAIQAKATEVAGDGNVVNNLDV